MTMRMVMPLVIAGLLLSSCEKEKKRITADPGPPTDQRRTVPSTSTSPQSAKKPPVSPAQEPRDQKETARDNRTQSNEARVKPDSPTSKPAEQKRAEQRAADAKKQAESVTPLDQSESEAHVDVTQRIRQALLREDLSFAAKNVLVITQGDHVVLKGQVRSASEAERIKGIAGTMTTKRIEDVLEVRP